MSDSTLETGAPMSAPYFDLPTREGKDDNGATILRLRDLEDAINRDPGRLLRICNREEQDDALGEEIEFATSVDAAMVMGFDPETVAAAERDQKFQALRAALEVQNSGRTIRTLGVEPERKVTGQQVRQGLLAVYIGQVIKYYDNHPPADIVEFSREADTASHNSRTSGSSVA